MRTRFPSSITRSQASGAASERVERKVTNEALAKMNSAELKAFYQRTGQWVTTSDVPEVGWSGSSKYMAQRDHYGRKD